MMKRRWRLGLLLTLLLLGGSLLHPAVHWRLIGWAEREAFYRGQPTSYWQQECENWLPLLSASSGRADVTWVRRRPEWEQRFAHLIGLSVSSYVNVPLVDGDPESVPVLLELLQRTSNNRVRIVALTGLEHVGPPARDAVPLLLRLVREKDDFDELAWQALFSIAPEQSPTRPTYTLTPPQAKGLERLENAQQQAESDPP
jgi:hypothetical protein